MPSFLDWPAWLALAQETPKAAPMAPMAAPPMAAPPMAAPMAAPMTPMIPMGGPMTPAGMNPMGGAGGQPPGGGGILEFIFGNPMILVAILGLMFYFTVLRPQQQKQSDHDKLLSDLKPNDRVYTIGGILGTIVDIDKDNNTITLRIDEKSGARIEVRRGYIGGLATDDDDDKKDS